MIHLLESDSKRLHEEYLAICGLDSPTLRMTVARSISMKVFPGALIPSSIDQSVVFISVPSIAIWERLAPLLLARIGATLSNFTGVPCSVSIVDPVAALLQERCDSGIFQIQLSENFLKSAWLALARLVENIEQYSARSISSTSTSPAAIVLSTFETAIEVGDVVTAQQQLNAMEKNKQIDALNLHFLRVRVLALAEDWDGIFSSGLYDTLQHIKAPAPVQLALDTAMQQRKT